MESNYQQRLENPNFYNISQIHKIIQTRPNNRNGQILPIYLSSNYSDIFLLFDKITIVDENRINFYIPSVVKMKQEIAQGDNQYGLICRYDVELYEKQFYTFYEKQFSNLECNYVILSCDCHRRFEEKDFNVLHYIVNDDVLMKTTNDVHLYIGVCKDVFMAFWQRCRVAPQNESEKIDVVYPFQNEVRFGGFPVINIIEYMDSLSPILKVPSTNIKNIIMETVENTKVDLPKVPPHIGLTPLPKFEPTQPTQPTQPAQPTQPTQPRNLLRSRYTTDSDSEIEQFHSKP